MRVTRGIERFPSDFDLGLMDYFPGSDQKQLVKEGMPCQVKLGSDLVITGYVDDWSPSISRSRHEVRATGRNKCCDLVDCSAEWPNNVINGGNALDIASRLASYYDITVSTDIDDLVSVPQFTLNWGSRRRKYLNGSPAGQLCSITISLTAIYFLPGWAQSARPAVSLKGKYRTGLLPPFDGRPLF